MRGAPVFKWHQLRRWRDDIAFSRDNLLAGARCGASLEIDLRALKDDEFLCLHDATLARETNGQGRVADMTAAEARQLLMRDAAGQATTQPPMLFGELVKHMCDADSATLMQLDFKDDIFSLSQGHLEFFYHCLADCAEKFLLSGDNVAGLRLLAKNLPQLRLGYDPCTESALSKLGDRLGFQHFAENAITAMPEASYIYLEYRLILAGLDAGVDLVAIFHDKGMKVDAYTLNSDHPQAEKILEHLIYAGVDQITTDEPEILARL